MVTTSLESSIVQAIVSSLEDKASWLTYADWLAENDRFAAIKGYVIVRWLGISNDYYSERVSFLIEGH